MRGRIGRYQLVRLLAAGGMGEVFLARTQGPLRLSRVVVIKRILRHHAQDPSFVEMFLNEARLAVPLTHPNIVQIYELGEEMGTSFISMEYVHGLSLHAITRKLRSAGMTMTPAVAGGICIQALRGLHHAHTLKGPSGWAMGLVHRDVTPDNLLVGFNGTVKVADFGIAKAMSSSVSTDAGTLKGKYAYLSPEQIDATAIDGRADLFSMGVVLYQLLAGQRPFDRGTDEATLRAIVETPHEDLRAHNGDVSDALAAVVQRALAKKASDRFRSAEEMANALEVALSREPERPTPDRLAQFLRERFPEEAGRPAPTPASLESEVQDGADEPLPPSEATTRAQEAPPVGETDLAPTRVLDAQANVRVRRAEPQGSVPAVAPPLPPNSGLAPAKGTPATPGQGVLLARIERAPVSDSEKRTRVPLAHRVEAFRPLMSAEVTRDFEREFQGTLQREEYAPLEANRAIDFLAARCLGDMDPADARRWAGRGFLMRYRESILGRVLLAAMPFLGVERLIQRSPREFAATTNYGTRTVYRVGPGHCTYAFEDEVTYAEFIEGILWAGSEVSHAPGLAISCIRLSSRDFFFDITWNPRGRGGDLTGAFPAGRSYCVPAETPL